MKFGAMCMLLHVVCGDIQYQSVLVPHISSGIDCNSNINFVTVNELLMKNMLFCKEWVDQSVTVEEKTCCHFWY